MVELEEDTIKCSRCEEATPESEVIEVGAWWVCGMCYDDI
jgi:formylmethanofuran dehydrogenase subunit E